MEMQDPEAGDYSAVPGHKNYLIYCDESGVHGAVYYAFGSLWMPWERRGDFVALIRELQEKYGFREELKWNHLSRKKENLYKALIDAFFECSWLMFHALIVRKGYTDKSFHKDFDEEKQKRLVMLLEKKIRRFRRGDPTKTYHVRVDPLPSRYKKADEKAFRILGSMLKKSFTKTPLESLITRHSHDSPGIQLVDFFLGATLADWQGDASSDHKLRVRRHLAEHLGWPDMRSDTHPDVWKFNIWYFYDRTGKREIPTRPVKFKVPIRLFLPKRSRTTG